MQTCDLEFIESYKYIQNKNIEEHKCTLKDSIDFIDSWVIIDELELHKLVNFFVSNFQKNLGLLPLLLNKNDITFIKNIAFLKQNNETKFKKNIFDFYLNIILNNNDDSFFDNQTNYRILKEIIFEKKINDKNDALCEKMESLIESLLNLNYLNVLIESNIFNKLSNNCKKVIYDWLENQYSNDLNNFIINHENIIEYLIVFLAKNKKMILQIFLKKIVKIF